VLPLALHVSVWPWAGCAEIHAVKMTAIATIVPDRRSSFDKTMFRLQR
jgi:hypothetical protein